MKFFPIRNRKYSRVFNTCSILMSAALASAVMAQSETEKKSIEDEIKKFEAEKLAREVDQVKAESKGKVTYETQVLADGSIVLMEDDKITKFITPRQLTAAGSFEIVVKRGGNAVAGERAPGAEPTEAERIEARRIMYKANQAFFKGDIEGTWDLVEQAEKLDPNYARVLSMKGSLLYKIGSVGLAKYLWNKSLQMDPNQEDIREALRQADRAAGRESIDKKETGRL